MIYSGISDAYATSKYHKLLGPLISQENLGQPQGQVR